MKRTTRSKNKRAAGTATTKPWRITSRIVNTKRHTVGYVINGQTYTVKQAARFARAGRIANVRAVGNHVQAETGKRSLSSLPTRIQR